MLNNTNFKKPAWYQPKTLYELFMFFFIVHVRFAY